MERAFIDLHCHTNASFDSLADPVKVARAAASRGLTHLIVTDHDRIDGALRARDAALDGLTVIVGEEVKTADGDLICAFLERAIAPGLSALATIAAAREQGGLVGIPHPFDRFRGSLSKSAHLAAIAPLVDWVEVHNARLVGGGNEEAAVFAREHGRPGVAVSDAHSVLEIGVAYTVLEGDPSTAPGLLAALAGLAGIESQGLTMEAPASSELVTGRASYTIRLWTPIAKAVQRLRGNGRVGPGMSG